MTVDSEKLRQTLNQLHQQLEEAERLDPDVAARLRATMDQIRVRLAQQGVLAEEEVAAEEPIATAAEEDVEENEEEPTFAERLTEAEQHFEASHPTLSNTLQRLVDILAQLGI